MSGPNPAPDRNPGESRPGPEERALAQRLRQAPRDEFRADQLARFLGAGTGERTPVGPSQGTVPTRTPNGAADVPPSAPILVQPTNDKHGPEKDLPTGRTSLSPGEVRLAQVLRQPSGPRADWRQEQRRAFLAGPVPVSAKPGAAPKPAPERVARPARNREVVPSSRNRLRLVASGLAIAAAALLFLRPAAVVDPRWELRGGADEVAVHNASLRDGVLLQETTAELDCAHGPTSLDLGRGVRVEMVPGTVARFCPPRSRQGVLVVPIELLSGELLVHLDASFGATRLVVQTPEGVVHLTGTSLSVSREDAGTCVCVAAGSVRVEVKGQERPALDVGRGASAFLFASGAAPRLLQGEGRLGFFGGESHWLQHKEPLTRSLEDWTARQR